MEDEVRIPISSRADIVGARDQGRRMAARLGFSTIDQTLVATAISELARNIVLYAGNGEITIRVVVRDEEQGIMVVAQDRGPGIPDVEQVMQLGYSTSGGLGIGLPGVKRILDHFQIASAPGRGTTVTTIKWRRASASP